MFWNLIQGEIGHVNMDVFVVPDTEDTINSVHHVDVNETDPFELERDDIEFVRPLGSGNFGEVFKASMSNETVAVKRLTGEIYRGNFSSVLSKLRKNND